jgi:subtilase family serine protease
VKPACARLQALKVLIASAIFLSLVGVAYPQVPQITRPVNDSVTVSLKGDVHPQAKALFDRGAVSDSQPMGTMMVTLKRPAEREAALQQFMVEVHKQGTATYHKWLTPAQYAQNFGPADFDIASVQTWLESQGFAVQKVSAGKTAIVFSGTAGQVRRAFHTQVHSYFVGGTNHYANSTAPMIPAGLSPVIAGVGPFHDFSPRSLSRVLGKATWDPQTHRVTPSWTVPTQNGNFYLVGPQDLATQYNLNPLYAAGITGAGQTIGIVNVSNIDLSVVAAYRKLFNLDGNSAPNLPQVVVDGADPGIGLAATEAYLDVEVSGALAPKATVKLYTSNNLLSAAIRAVDDDEATVLSVSFGTCEPELGPSGNAFINALWQQAAAQGQTVMVATGDSGAAGCSGSGFGVDFYGLQVNGFASTPWNVGVGGTDFYYKDYASGGASITKYWDATNGLGQRSMKSPIPEQPWNQSPYGKNIRLPSETIEGVIINEVAGGGGGQSQCAVPGNGNDPMVDPNGVRYCTGLGGYPKPAWQSGPGVPKDSVRDLPDVALFAAAGTNDSTYAICVSLGDCVAKDPSNGIATFVGVGGTSASTPAFAGIMALVNQKYGAQGQANNVLYSLAANHSSVFHDIAVGSINEPCYNVNAPIAVLLGGANSGIPADPECLLDANSTTLYSLQKWPATVGYDLATGLGSVDANALVAHWNTLSYSPTATVLAATPASITHGQNVTLSASVSGAGVPTGSVAIISDLNLPASKGLLAIPLDDTGAGAVTVQSLPGGRYTLFGRYGGDTSFASSESPPI